MSVLDRLNVSIQSKLMLMLLFVAVTAIGVISWISYSTSKTALTESAFKQLTSIRASKKIQIEAFFKTIRYQVSNLADDLMIVSATREFEGDFEQLRKGKAEPDQTRLLTSFYRDKFLPELASKSTQVPRLEAYFPEGVAARYLQFHYIEQNPYPDKRYRLLNAGDGSEYSRHHARYQPVLTKFMIDFGYDNLILVNPRTGDVVYTYTKSPLFATNLRDGPYSNTSAGKLFESIHEAGSRRRVHVVDFAPMPSELGKPVALMGAPVYEGQEEIGILMIQFPVDEINRVMTDNFGWAQDGLGRTGEVYLVGPDNLMRSRSRLLHEDPKGYYEQLERADYPPDEIERVRRSGTATLAQSARTLGVADALNGKSGTAILDNYLHLSTLSSYAPLSVPGLHWVIVAEMQAEEAFAPLTVMTRRLVTWSLVTVLCVTMLAAIFGRNFVRPIFRLVDGIDRLKTGERDVIIQTGSRDEFEDVGTAFNRITRRITAEYDKLAITTRARDEFLDNLLPEPAAERMKAGLPREIDEYPEVSILFAGFRSRGESTLSRSIDKSLSLLADLTIALDDAAERRGLHKLSSNGSTYAAACGLSRQRLDHATRTIDFAYDILRIVQHLHRDRQTDLYVTIGITSGSAAGGVVGIKRMTYQLAGDAMSTAGAFAAYAPPNAILVSRPVYAATQNLYRFGASLQISPLGGEPLTAWPLRLSEAEQAGAGNGVSEVNHV